MDHQSLDVIDHIKGLTVHALRFMLFWILQEVSKPLYYYKWLPSSTVTALYLHHYRKLSEKCNGIKIHTVTVDYPITWEENTVKVEIFLVLG